MSRSIGAFWIAALAVATGAAAQSAHPYVGTWHAAYENANGKSRQGTVVITEAGGTWDMDVSSRGNPCQGRAVPITIRKATADELVFSIDRSAALPGCKDGTASLKRIDATTLDGEFDRFKMKMTRK